MLFNTKELKIRNFKTIKIIINQTKNITLKSIRLNLLWKWINLVRRSIIQYTKC